MDQMLLGADFLSEIEVERFISSIKPKSEAAILYFKYDTYELVCQNGKTGKVDTYVNLFEVKEIRTGKRCIQLKHWTTTSSTKKKIDLSRCFSIVYGMGFRLKTLSIAAPTKKEAEEWVNGLQYLIAKRPTCYLDRLDCWLAKQFDVVVMTPLTKRRGSLTLRELKEFTSQINLKIGTNLLTDKFQDSNVKNFFSFQKLLREFLYDHQIFLHIFGKYSSGESSHCHVGDRRMSLNVFQEFLHCEQNDSNPPTDYYQYCREYAGLGNKEQGSQRYISCQEVVDYLFSKENQVWDVNCDKVYQDMTKPLSNYWIASSHNTYLMGDQVSSESSVEAYARCLLQGCRCIELDIWDGPKSIPEIYHGRTLTTKVGLVEVLKTIRDYAFETSEYPVILSIENHCSITQQKTMVKKFHEVFGSMLVTKPLFKEETELPSPHALRKRIILKGKKVSKSKAESIGEEHQDKEKTPADLLLDSFKSGKMYLQEGGQWEAYFFVLTSDKLIYTEVDGSEGHGKHGVDVSNADSCQSVPVKELHQSEIWYHGQIADLDQVEKRLKRFGVEGGFLVRESEKKSNSFTLSFMSQDTVFHLDISTTQDYSTTEYYFIPTEKFESLYALVTHYQKFPLDTPNFCIQPFSKPVPQPKIYPETLSWFYPNTLHPEPMGRKQAEEILKKIPLNGAFLVRYSQAYLNGDTKEGRFVITFRMENRIRHCRVKEDGRLFFVMSNQPRFDSIQKLIHHYSKQRSFYNGRKLKHEVNGELHRFAHNNMIQNLDDYNKIYTSPDYEVDVCSQARAVHAYQPAEDHLLCFKRGDIITNVVKEDEFWWKGDLAEQTQKYFPANFVEEMEPVDSPFGKLQKGSLNLGKVDMEQEKKHDEYPFVLKLYSSRTPVPYRIALKTEKEAKEWQEMINWVYNRQESSSPTKKLSLFKFKPKKEKIAPEFSKQIVYCCSVSKLCPDQVLKNGRVFTEMTSYNEVTADNKISLNPEFYLWLHQVQLSRVYPKGQRIDSSNYNPIRFWNHGCQMVALNYQTADRPMQLNHGRFRDNGRCGYVLRPDFMFQKNFDPSRVMDLTLNGIQHTTFEITIIAARHLFRSDNKTGLNPVVEIQILGADFDCQKVRTKTNNADNGFNPYWNETFTLKILNPDLALVQFSVYDQDSFDDSHMVGQGTYPAKCLRGGYRSVVLENGYGEELLSKLLIHLQYSYGSTARKTSNDTERSCRYD